MSKVYLLVELSERHGMPIFARTFQDATIAADRENCHVISEADRDNEFPFDVIPTGTIWNRKIGGWEKGHYSCPLHPSL